MSDRTPQPCQHKYANHQHGTHACYVLDRCRCHPCRRANSAYERRRTKNNAYGRSNLVPAEPVRRHVRTLRAQGLGTKWIAALAGVSHGSLSKLVYGERGLAPSRRVRRETARKLLSVPLPSLEQLPVRKSIDALGTRRRLRALIAIG